MSTRKKLAAGLALAVLAAALLFAGWKHWDSQLKRVELPFEPEEVRSIDLYHYECAGDPAVYEITDAGTIKKIQTRVEKTVLYQEPQSVSVGGDSYGLKFHLADGTVYSVISAEDSANYQDGDELADSAWGFLYLYTNGTGKTVSWRSVEW